MKVIQNKFIPFKGYSAIMLFGLLFTRDKSRITATTKRHETIHTFQMVEVNAITLLLLCVLCLLWLSWWWLLLALVAYYLVYITEWLIRLFLRGCAYRNISFEREAYANQSDTCYLERRRLFSFFKYIKK